MYFVNLLQGQVLTFGGGKNFYYISLVKLGEREVNRNGKCCLCTPLKAKTKLYINSPRNHLTFEGGGGGGWGGGMGGFRNSWGKHILH